MCSVAVNRILVCVVKPGIVMDTLPIVQQSVSVHCLCGQIPLILLYSSYGDVDCHCLSFEQWKLKHFVALPTK